MAPNAGVVVPNAGDADVAPKAEVPVPNADAPAPKAGVAVPKAVCPKPGNAVLCCCCCSCWLPPKRLVEGCEVAVRPNPGVDGLKFK